MSFGSRMGSSLTTARALVFKRSAKPPSREMPVNSPFSQCMSSPARHARHRPQVMSGWQITVSPTSTLVTAEPTSSTQPEFSCPSTYGRSVLSGSCIGCHWPSMTWMSVRQSPAAPTRTITSSGFSMVGSSISSTLRLSSGCCRRTGATSRPSCRSLLSLGDTVACGEQAPAQLGVALYAHPHRPCEPEVLYHSVFRYPFPLRINDERRATRDIKPEIGSPFEILLQRIRHRYVGDGHPAQVRRGVVLGEEVPAELFLPRDEGLAAEDRPKLFQIRALRLLRKRAVE